MQPSPAALTLAAIKWVTCFNSLVRADQGRPLLLQGCLFNKGESTLVKLVAVPHMLGLMAHRPCLSSEPQWCHAMWQRRLRGHDAVLCHGCDRGVIGLFDLGASSHRPPCSRVVLQLLTYPDSRGTLKWANMSIFSQPDYSLSKSQGIFFFLHFSVWFIITLRRVLCAAQFFSPKWCRWYSLLLLCSPTLLVWMVHNHQRFRNLSHHLLFFFPQQLFLGLNVGRTESTPFSDKSSPM